MERKTKKFYSGLLAGLICLLSGVLFVSCGKKIAEDNSVDQTDRSQLDGLDQDNTKPSVPESNDLEFLIFANSDSKSTEIDPTENAKCVGVHVYKNYVLFPSECEQVKSKANQQTPMILKTFDGESLSCVLDSNLPSLGLDNSKMLTFRCSFYWYTAEHDLLNKINRSPKSRLIYSIESQSITDRSDQVQNGVLFDEEYRFWGFRSKGRDVSFY